MHDHGYGIGTEFYVERAVKVINGLYQSDAADLEEVVHIFAAGMKAFDDA